MDFSTVMEDDASSSVPSGMLFEINGWENAMFLLVVGLLDREHKGLLPLHDRYWVCNFHSVLGLFGFVATVNSGCKILIRLDQSCWRAMW